MKQCQGENDSVSSSPLCANHCHRQDGNLKVIEEHEGGKNEQTHKRNEFWPQELGRISQRRLWRRDESDTHAKKEG